MKHTYFRDLLVKTKEEAKCIITGIEYDKNCSCGKGAAKAPRVIRELSSFLPPLTMDGKNIKDILLFDNGNIKKKSKDYFYDIEEEANKLFSLNKFNFFIGGDHSISIPLQKSFFKNVTRKGKIPTIIHIDAHPDICDYYDGSYNSHACTNRRALDNGYKNENICLIGIRGYEEQEVVFLGENKNLTVFNASMINKEGTEKIKAFLLEHFNDEHEIYLSYDIDANDPSTAPGTGTPEAFGLNSLVLLDLIIFIVNNLNVTAMDIVEISPPLDSNNITSWLALKTLYEIFNIVKDKKI